MLPVTSAATVMPAMMASGKVPGRNHDADAEREIHNSSFSPGNLQHRIGRGIAQHLAGVIFAEIDRLAKHRRRPRARSCRLRTPATRRTRTCVCESAPPRATVIWTRSRAGSRPMWGNNQRPLPPRGAPSPTWPCGACRRPRRDATDSSSPADRRWRRARRRSATDTRARTRDFTFASACSIAVRFSAVLKVRERFVPKFGQRKSRASRESCS